ncbi:MAG: NAD-dependent epimerase/dehydratase family protein [Bacilli bacterium]
MKVLVTGGAGFIGSHVVDALLAQGISVVVVDDLSTGVREQVPSLATFYRIPLLDPKLEQIFAVEHPDAVIHQAAQVSVEASLRDPLFDAGNNILGTIRLLEHCRKHGVAKLVYASSCAVYGNPETDPIAEDHPVQPLSAYGVSKAAPELYLKLYHELYGMQYTVLRYANVYGPRQRSGGEGAVVPAFINRLLTNRPPIVHGDGLQRRDFVFVKDVAEANVAALSVTGSNVMNIGSNASVSILELLRLLQSEIGRDVLPVRGPSRPGDIRQSRLDGARAMEILKWKPLYDLEEGLRETVAFYRKAMKRQF